MRTSPQMRFHSPVHGPSPTFAWYDTKQLRAPSGTKKQMRANGLAYLSDITIHLTYRFLHCVSPPAISKTASQDRHYTRSPEDALMTQLVPQARPIKEVTCRDERGFFRVLTTSSFEREFQKLIRGALIRGRRGKELLRGARDWSPISAALSPQALPQNKKGRSPMADGPSFVVLRS